MNNEIGKQFRQNRGVLAIGVAIANEIRRQTTRLDERSTNKNTTRSGRHIKWKVQFEDTRVSIGMPSETKLGKKPQKLGMECYLFCPASGPLVMMKNVVLCFALGNMRWMQMQKQAGQNENNQVGESKCPCLTAKMAAEETATRCFFTWWLKDPTPQPAAKMILTEGIQSSVQKAINNSIIFWGLLLLCRSGIKALGVGFNFKRSDNVKDAPRPSIQFDSIQLSLRSEAKG